MGLIDLQESFNAGRISKLRHQFASHPLMTTDSLAALALRMDPRFVRFHDGERRLATSMSAVLTTDPTRQSLRKALDNLYRAHAFVQIINVHSDATYRPFVDAFLDEVSRALPAEERRFVNRDAAAFLASPGSVTPFHLDHEQNFLCHIRGKKTLWVWNPLDRDVVSERALEIFYREGTQRQVVYATTLQSHAQAFALDPGDAVFMPMGAPHAVETGDEVAVTFSMLFNTRSSMELVQTYRANYLLRRLGLSPPPVGQSWLRDALKRYAFEAVHGAFALATGHKTAPPHWY